jgi:uncharacterized protein YlxP (DUF503 family)
MVVAVARVSLVVMHSHSLKEKRAVVRKLKDRIAARYDVRLAEVGGQDTWQRAVLGFAVVGGERRVVESVRDDVVRAIEDLAAGEVVAVDRDTLQFDELGLA